jgi:oxaloacetate decarboxylase gamma subunit
MTIAEMLGQSGILTVLGMLVVFVFLWIMIICISLAGRIIHKFRLDKDIEEAPPEAGGKRAAPPPRVAAAITAAVAEFRKTEN